MIDVGANLTHSSFRDDLEAVVRENTKNRTAELARCREIITACTADLMDRLNPPSVKPDRETVEIVPGWSMSLAAA